MKRILLLLCVLVGVLMIPSSSYAETFPANVEKLLPQTNIEYCGNRPDEGNGCFVHRSWDAITKKVYPQPDGSVIYNTMILSYYYNIEPQYREGINPSEFLIRPTARAYVGIVIAPDGITVKSDFRAVYGSPNEKQHCVIFRYGNYLYSTILRDGAPKEFLNICGATKYYSEATKEEQENPPQINNPKPPTTTTTTTTTKPDNTTPPTTTSNLKDCKKIRIDGDLYKLETKNIKCLKARKMAKRLYEQDKFEMDDEYMIYEKNKVVIKLTIINE